MSFDPSKMLGETQGERTNAPKLEIMKKVEVDNVKCNPTFVYYDKATTSNLEVESPIQGILLGTTMYLEAFSRSLGTKGGSYKSDYYVGKHEVKLYEPTPKGSQLAIKGSLEEVETWLSKNRAEKPRKRMVMFIVTDKGLYTVYTNLTIAIDQISQAREALRNRYIILTPELYNVSRETISKKAKEMLGPLAEANPPSFAEISAGELIIEHHWNSWNMNWQIQKFKEWRDFKFKARGEEGFDKTTQPQAPQQPKRDELKEQGPPPSQPVNDDLPF